MTRRKCVSRSMTVFIMINGEAVKKAYYLMEFQKTECVLLDRKVTV